MLPKILQTHIDYTAWASQRLVQAAAALPGEEQTRDFKSADRSVVGTLAHVYAADRIWLARIAKGPSPAEFITEADRNLVVLENEWPQLYARWKQFAAGITEASAVAPVNYRDLKGREWTQPLWQLMLHVVNHATHHRGQVSGFLRAMGRTPPVLDLVVYYRELAASEQG